jgi:hypothetical protein
VPRTRTAAAAAAAATAGGATEQPPFPLADIVFSTHGFEQDQTFHLNQLGSVANEYQYVKATTTATAETETEEQTEQAATTVHPPPAAASQRLTRAMSGHAAASSSGAAAAASSVSHSLPLSDTPCPRLLGSLDKIPPIFFFRVLFPEEAGRLPHNPIEGEIRYFPKDEGETRPTLATGEGKEEEEEHTGTLTSNATQRGQLLARNEVRASYGSLASLPCVCVRECMYRHRDD